MTLQTTAAVFVTLVGSVSVYLAVPHQKLLARKPSDTAMYGLSVAAFTVAIMLLNRIFGAATSVFFMVTIATLTWTILPLVAAYLNDRNNRNNRSAGSNCE